MGAFCVFGMTEVVARQAAEKAWEKHVSFLPQVVRENLTVEQEAEWKQIKIEQLMMSGKSVQLSAPFDAPQFARDFISLTSSTTRSQRLVVMTRGELKDKTGQPHISKATKRPLIGWVPY